MIQSHLNSGTSLGSSLQHISSLGLFHIKIWNWGFKNKYSEVLNSLSGTLLTSISITTEL
jgi:hypothetical protein